MVPSETDLLSHIFAGLGVEEFNKFNKLHPENYDDGASIDDSQAATHTVTAHENDEGAKPSGAVKHEQHVDENGDETKTTTTTTTTTYAHILTSPAASADTSSGATTKEPVKGEDAVEDTDDFVETLFEVLRKKFRQAINASDEIAL
ncbi:hypothetical protein BJX64DRAFT_262396 [Aspergillus heterothallicus]